MTFVEFLCIAAMLVCLAGIVWSCHKAVMTEFDRIGAYFDTVFNELRNESKENAVFRDETERRMNDLKAHIMTDITAAVCNASDVPVNKAIAIRAEDVEEFVYYVPSRTADRIWFWIHHDKEDGNSNYYDYVTSIGWKFNDDKTSAKESIVDFYGLKVPASILEEKLDEMNQHIVSGAAGEITKETVVHELYWDITHCEAYNEWVTEQTLMEENV